MIIVTMSEKNTLERFPMNRQPAFNRLCIAAVYQPHIVALIFIEDVSAGVLIVVYNLASLQHPQSLWG
jgi:hypothetical protein